MDNQSTKKPAYRSALTGAILFSVLILLLNTIPDNIVLVAVVAVAFHIVLFPVVAALPSTSWARAAGYGWLILDIAANIMYINGIEEPTCTALRYGAHIPAIIWIFVSSFHCNRMMQIAGLPLCIIMGSYSFIAPWAPSWMLYPAMVLLVIWLLLSAKFLYKNK